MEVRKDLVKLFVADETMMTVKDRLKLREPEMTEM